MEGRRGISFLSGLPGQLPILTLSRLAHYLAVSFGATAGTARVLEASHPFQDSPSFVYLKVVCPECGLLQPSDPAAFAVLLMLGMCSVLQKALFSPGSPGLQA